jgi:hypothetical protein
MNALFSMIRVDAAFATVVSLVIFFWLISYWIASTSVNISSAQP